MFFLLLRGRSPAHRRSGAPLAGLPVRRMRRTLDAALFSRTHALPSLERLAGPCEFRVPQFLVARKPRLQFTERFGTQRIEAVLPFGSDSYKPCFQQQA